MKPDRATDLDSGVEETGAGLKLALLVGAARSGTTLLRLILDAHPEIGCPAEAGIPSLIQTLGRVWWTIEADEMTDGAGDPQAPSERRAQPADDEQGPHDGALPQLPPNAKDEIRRAALAPMRHYCGRESKRLYCDKSLDSVYHLEAVRQVFPKTRYVLLFRHVMDTVASGIEASPFGFHAYGYFPFVQRSPDNFVAALVDYWLRHVEIALGWEEAHPELCHRLRYEDLVTSPEKVVHQLFEFLGVKAELFDLENTFEKGPQGGRPWRLQGEVHVDRPPGVDWSWQTGAGRDDPAAATRGGEREAYGAWLRATHEGMECRAVSAYGWRWHMGHSA